MKSAFRLSVVIVLWILQTQWTLAVSPTAGEMTQAQQWTSGAFDGSQTFFSFTYNGQSSAQLLPTWNKGQSTRVLDANRTEHTLTYTDPSTKLQVRCVGIAYNDYPTVEWTVHFKNTNPASDTLLIENVQALDSTFSRTQAQSEYVLRHNTGSLTSAYDYQPLSTTLNPNQNITLGTTGGRPLNVNMPYFNLGWGNQGVIAAVGWTGQWKSDWTRDGAYGLRVTSGQENTHFKLLPGEEVRSPMVALQFYEGNNVARSQNIWRRWMVKHNLPQPGGKPMPTAIAGIGGTFQPSVAEQLPLIYKYPQRGLKPDYWWMDAGWYPSNGDWHNTGTWEPDPVRFPNGLGELADAAHGVGMKFDVWFEPERVTAGTWLATNHPEWIIGGANGGKLNLGNPDALNWVINHFDQLIKDGGIDMYRQDFNMDPLSYWRSVDASNRQGITEMKDVAGLYAYWDELKRRNPDMPFDNCASGGRRNDLEMMRRGIPVSRSDYGGGTFSTSSQCQTYGISSWLPYYGAGTMSNDPYVMRSNIAPFFAVNWDVMNPDLDYDTLRKQFEITRKIAPLMLGDYYPLTTYTMSENVWMAWQFDVPEDGEGVVQAFRRSNNTAQSFTFYLQGLDPDALYRLSNVDVEGETFMTGLELMQNGLPISIQTQPGAAIILYEVVPEPSALVLMTTAGLGLAGYVWRRRGKKKTTA